jgi:protein-S-isoprenylcysteine O-methyltransferase Ste14
LDGLRKVEKLHMFKDPLHWFPDPFFSTILAVLVLGAFFIDYALPKALTHRYPEYPIHTQDRSSFRIIQAAGLVAIVAAVICRYLNWTIAPSAIQYIGLLLIPVGLAIREWAIIKLGRFFARTVQIEPGHRLITDGPYRWIRHPAYTGMVLIYLGIALAMGTWLGGAATLGIMLAATLYRIRVEEQVLIQFFGNEYRDYMKRTWRLFPGW